MEALGMQKAAPSSLTEIASGSKQDFNKLDEFREIMPVIRELEVRTIGESAIRMNQEAEQGYSDEKVALSARHFKQLDEEISRNNSSVSGRIVWLRRSRCSDPDHLNGRPDVLPNPKLWRQRIADEASISKGSEVCPEESTPSTSVSRSIETSAKNKMIKADAAVAQQRLISFQKGASDIAATASAMLKLTENNTVVPVAEHNNIVVATNKFRRVVLTPREVAWYQSLSKTRDIGLQAEARADAEEKKPWKLLNLPEETPAQMQRKELQIREREERYLEIEKQLRPLLVRDGEGEYNPDRQVVSFDGFAPARSQDIDKMTRPQLEALVKGRMKAKDIKVLKVDQLRIHIKKLVQQHPELLQIPTASAAREMETVTEAPTAQDMSTINPPTDTQSEDSCPVLEVLHSLYQVYIICVYLCQVLYPTM